MSTDCIVRFLKSTTWHGQIWALAVALSWAGCLTNLAVIQDGLVDILSGLFSFQWSETGYWIQPVKTRLLPNIIMLEKAIYGCRICLGAIWENFPISTFFPKVHVKDSFKDGSICTSISILKDVRLRFQPLMVNVTLHKKDKSQNSSINGVSSISSEKSPNENSND